MAETKTETTRIPRIRGANGDGMILFDSEIAKHVPTEIVWHGDEEDDDNPIAYLKYFNVINTDRIFVLSAEYIPGVDDVLLKTISSNMQFTDAELNTESLRKLAREVNMPGMGYERDITFTPAPMSELHDTYSRYRETPAKEYIHDKPKPRPKPRSRIEVSNADRNDAIGLAMGLHSVHENGLYVQFLSLIQKLKLENVGNDDVIEFDERLQKLEACIGRMLESIDTVLGIKSEGLFYEMQAAGELK